MEGANQYIRTAVAADASAVRSLTRAAYAKWVPVLGREPLPMLADYDLAVMNHQIDLLFSGGVLVGLIEMVFERSHLMIENLAIDTDHQQKGYGKYLLQHAHGVAYGKNVNVIRLLTNKLMSENVQLYLRNGYQIDREEPFMGGITIHMSQKI